MKRKKIFGVTLAVVVSCGVLGSSFGQESVYASGKEPTREELQEDYGTFRHTGMWDDNLKRLITAQPRKGVIWEYQTQWNNRYPQIFGSYVPSLTLQQRANATKYAVEQLGEPFDRTFPKTVSYKWYCSKLSWASIHGYGVDIDKNGGYLVTPDDIYYDNNTVYFTHF